MKILEAVAKKEGRVEIPDCSRVDLPEFFEEMGFEIGVEIGVQRASFLIDFCKKGFKMFGVDPWLGYKDYKDENNQVHQDKVYTAAKKVVAKFPSCTLIRKKSMDAVNDFEDDSLDFVYIDGHHGFKFVTEDIFEWSKKVRKGGVICGHDYDYIKPHIQVRYVVDAYTQAFGIENWWVLGSNKRVKGEKRDTYRSWMWFK